MLDKLPLEMKLLDSVRIYMDEKEVESLSNRIMRMENVSKPQDENIPDFLEEKEKGVYQYRYRVTLKNGDGEDYEARILIGKVAGSASVPEEIQPEIGFHSRSFIEFTSYKGETSSLVSIVKKIKEDLETGGLKSVAIYCGYPSDYKTDPVPQYHILKS